MNIKKAIIETCDVMAYLAFAAVCVVAFLLLVSTGVTAAFIALVAGWFSLSIIFGFWFVLSSIAEESAMQTKIMAKIAERLQGE